MRVKVENIYQIGDKAIILINGCNYLVNLNKFLSSKKMFFKADHGNIIPKGYILRINNYSIRDDVVYFERNIIVSDGLELTLTGTIDKNGKILNWFNINEYKMYLSDDLIADEASIINEGVIPLISYIDDLNDTEYKKNRVIH